MDVDQSRGKSSRVAVAREIAPGMFTLRFFAVAKRRREGDASSLDERVSLGIVRLGRVTYDVR